MTKKSPKVGSVSAHPIGGPDPALRRDELFNEWLHGNRRPSTEEAKVHAVGWWDHVMNADKWCARQRVKPAYAAMLLSGFNPFSNDDDIAWRESLDEKTMVDYHRHLQMWCEEEGADHTLAEWHRMAKANGLTVHSWFQEYVDAGGKWLPDGPTPDASSEPVSESRQEPAKPISRHAVLADLDSAKEKLKLDLDEKIVRLAKQYLADEIAADRHPAQSMIADYVARKLRKDGTMGIRGEPLTGAYIKRHFLKGISASAYRKRSIVPRRGK